MNMTSLNCIPLDCSQCPARGHTPLVALDSVELSAISRDKGCRSYERGEIIYHADDRPTGIFCIYQGTVKLYKLGRDGTEHIVGLVRNGDIMGYRAFLGGDTYGVYAEPLDSVRLCHIPGVSLLPMLSSNYGLSHRVMTLLASDLRAAEDKVVDMAQRSVRERLAEALLMLKQTFGVDDKGGAINTRVTRGELAGIVGAALESVSRQLSGLREEGMVELVGRKIRIVDDRALLEIAMPEG
jgi:CRP/FNR family transcriptional regulator